MTMLQIKQLTSTNKNITCEQQKQVLGGGAGPHNVKKKSASAEPLWNGYADGQYDLGQRDNYIYFKENSGSYEGNTTGSINTETGFVKRFEYEDGS